MILHRYFARRFLWMFLALLAVFATFQLLLDFTELLRRLDDRVGLGQVIRMTFLKTPEGLYQIIPLVMILATISLFIGLSRSSELVVTRASGRSGLTLLAGPVTVALIIGMLIVGVMNPLVATTSKHYQEQLEAYRSGGGSVLSIGSEGLWLRQGDPQGQTVIRAARANGDASVLYDVTFIAYAPEAGPVRRIHAAEASLDQDGWTLTDAKAWPLAAGLNPETSSERHETLRIPSTLTQESIRDRFGNPASISVWNLPAFITDLEDAGISARRHLVWLQMELARPVFLLAMVLIGAAFTMRPARLGHTGLGILSAVLLGFGLYYVRSFAQVMGENGQLSPLLAAWVPPVASVLLALGLVLQMEDG